MKHRRRSYFEAAVITASDKVSKGECEDLSGQKICGILEGAGYKRVILPDKETLLDRVMLLFVYKSAVH